MREAGLMVSEIAFSNMPLLIKRSGLDFFILDCEHGGFDYADVSRMIMNAKLCGCFSIVRLADNKRKDIMKFADMGADGFLLPMTNSADDIEQVVKFAKYQPIGQRGISTMRAHTCYDPPAVLEYMAQANAKTKVFAQIETVSGVNRVGEILAVNGVDGVFVGPNDLSADYGCLGDSSAREILSAVESVGAAAYAANKIAGIITGNANYIAKAKESGFRLFCKGSELNAIADYCRAVAHTVRS